MGQPWWNTDCFLGGCFRSCENPFYGLRVSGFTGPTMLCPPFTFQNWLLWKHRMAYILGVSYRKWGNDFVGGAVSANLIKSERKNLTQSITISYFIWRSLHVYHNHKATTFPKPLWLSDCLCWGGLRLRQESFCSLGNTARERDTYGYRASDADRRTYPRPSIRLHSARKSVRLGPPGCGDWGVSIWASTQGMWGH